MSSDIIAMAREAGAIILDGSDTSVIERFAALAQAAERNKLAAWMIAQGYATGHGDTIEGLLEELEREIGFDKAELWLKRINEAVLAEREACALVCINIANKPSNVILGVAIDCAAAIRART
jgi:hypothetical protein